MVAGNTLSVIIVAGGSGQRMGSEIPKQFLPLGDETVLMKSIRCFSSLKITGEIIVVLPASRIPEWENLCRKYAFDISHKTVAGGHNRFESVRAGLTLCDPQNTFIAVHDGVRPFVSGRLIGRIFEEALLKGNAVPSVLPTDTLRRLTGGGTSVCLDRTLFRAVQTPQIFRSELIRRAYEKPFKESFTDDASVLEEAGISIHLVEGEYTNIKLTTPLDLLAAREWIRLREN